MLRSNNQRFSELSVPRQTLLRACQLANFGFIQGLRVSNREPHFDPPPVVQIDLKLNSKTADRREIGSADFILSAECMHLMTVLDDLGNGLISELEVRAGLPRRVRFGMRISELSRYGAAAQENLPVARQAGSKGPVRRLVVESERETAAAEAAGHQRDGRGGRGSEDASRREYPETTRVGDCLDS